uniref:Uncharacterized protein n=1 Tax=Arundo donax TaxID=35708 RepID=A0A0A9EF12_ARUDO
MASHSAWFALWGLWRHDAAAGASPKERTETELELPMSLIQLRREPGAVSEDRLLS